MLVIGYDDHGYPNQRVIVSPFIAFVVTWHQAEFCLQWTFENNGSGWTIKSAGSGKYIGIESGADDGTPLVAVDDPFVWDIWPDERDASHFRCVGCVTSALCELIFHVHEGSSSPTPAKTLIYLTMVTALPERKSSFGTRHSVKVKPGLSSLKQGK